LCAMAGKSSSPPLFSTPWEVDGESFFLRGAEPLLTTLLLGMATEVQPESNWASTERAISCIIKASKNFWQLKSKEDIK
jgi:hypothetical protein